MGKKYFIEILHTDTTYKKKSKFFKEIFHILKFDKLQVFGTAGKNFSLHPPCLSICSRPLTCALKCHHTFKLIDQF